MDGILFSVYLSVHEPLCALRLEKHGLMDGWRSWSRGKDIKGIDNKDETLDMFWFGHERPKDSGGIWMAPEAPFPPFFPPFSLSVRLLFHTSRIKYNQSFHIFLPPSVRCWKRETETRLLHWDELSLWCYFMGLNFISGMHHFKACWNCDICSLCMWNYSVNLNNEWMNVYSSI